MPLDLFCIANTVRGSLVCDRARIADTFLTRLVGLLGKECLRQGEGLLIIPSSGVHTWGMAFPIDIVALDENYRITKTCPDTGPWRIGGLGLSTRSILELPAGQIRRSQTVVGDVLSITPAQDTWSTSESGGNKYP